MSDISELSDEQLTEELQQRKVSLRVKKKSDNEDALLHDLQVHQIELEMQNRELQESQARLEQARDRYSDLYDFAPIGYATFDEHGCVQEINLTACQLLGMERARISGKPFTSFIPQRSKLAFLQHIHEVFLAKGKVITETRLTPHRQTPVHVRLESIAFENALDNTTSCRTAIIDISDSKRVHEELRQQLDFAENLIETAASIVLVLNPEGKIVRVNSFLEKLTGYAREEILGKDWFATFIPEQEQQRVRSVFANAASGMRTTGFINPIVTKDGKEKIIDWYDAEQKDSQGNLTGVLSIGQDVTPRIEAEMSSYESRHQLRLLTDALPVLIAYVDPQQKIRFHNRHCQTWLAIPTEQINDGSLDEVFGAAAYEVLSPLINTVLAGEEVSASFELPLSPDNKPYVMANFIPDLGRNDEVKGFFALMNDITRYRTEEVNAKQRLTSLAHESRLNMMGEMAAEIAHELNQPLTAISNYADACLRLQKSDKLQPHDITDVLNEINDQVHRANQIIRHIRDFTQKRELQLQCIDVNGLIKEVLQLVAGELNWQDIAVTTQLTDARPTVVVDSVLLKQVLLNLINNAIEAMAAANTTDRRIAISTVVTNRHVAIEVADNGPGISDELTEIIFKPFFTTKAEGMGLGLSMCQSIIESHEGSLLVRENTAGGATFCVRLTLAPAE